MINTGARSAWPLASGWLKLGCGPGSSPGARRVPDRQDAAQATSTGIRSAEGCAAPHRPGRLRPPDEEPTPHPRPRRPIG